MIRFPYTRLTRTYAIKRNFYSAMYYFIWVPTNYAYRLTPLTTPPVEKSTMMNLSLQEIILIGNASEQVGKNRIIYYILRTYGHYAS